MPSVLAIVSKAVFEKQAPGATVGLVVGFDRYASTHKALDPVGQGGDLYLVTVRPPDEKLWLVGILPSPEKRSDGWYAGNATAIVDISALKSVLKFANGAGLPTKAGALGMSLQTPRVLTDADVAALRKAAGAPATVAAAPAPAPKAKVKAAKAAAGGVAPAPAPSPAPSPTPTPTPTPPPSGAGPIASLATALEAWRARPIPALADAIDALSDAIAAQLPAISDDTAWSRAAAGKRPEDVQRLLAAFTTLPAATVKPRMERLAELPRDPRVARALAAWALEPPTTSSSNFPMWTTAFKVLAAASDARAIPVLEKRLKMAPGGSQFWPRHYAAIERTLEALRKSPPPSASKDDRALIETLTRAAKELASGALRLEAAAPAKKAAAPVADGPPLRRARALLESGQLAPAVEAMLEGWRARKLPALGDLVERVSDVIHVGKAPPWGKPKQLQAEWLARFERDAAGELPLLLAALPDASPSEIERRVQELAQLPDDPRVARRVCDLAFASISPERTGLWRQVFDLVARTGDLGAHQLAHARYPNLEQQPYDFDRWRQAKRALAPLGEARLVGVEPTKEEAAELAALTRAADAAIAAQTAEQRHLIAAIVDDPEDDGPRLIYGDWLLERENPWGELIQLQIQGTASARAKELDETARRAGLGSFVDAFEKFTVERGFPVEMTRAYWRSARAVARTHDSPLWPFVRAIHGAPYRGQDRAPLKAVEDVLPKGITLPLDEKP